jgi:hypothetical protein
MTKDRKKGKTERNFTKETDGRGKRKVTTRSNKSLKQEHVSKHRKRGNKHNKEL